jgi:hypothetical protein
MNRRIGQLAEQCGFRSNPDVYDRNQSFDIEKFAELIVRDCVLISRTSTDGFSAGRRMEQHFGFDH